MRTNTGGLVVTGVAPERGRGFPDTELALTGLAAAAGGSAGYSVDIVARDGTRGIKRVIEPEWHAPLRRSIPAGVIGAGLVGWGAWEGVQRLGDQHQEVLLLTTGVAGGIGLGLGGGIGFDSARIALSTRSRLYHPVTYGLTGMGRRLFMQELLGYMLPGIVAGVTAGAGIGAAFAMNADETP